ncbi:MAG: NAD(P)-binding protein [Pseudomonadales bacterium]|nr:NAD(P)-binding protein [Pseudomonadales bacterium]
MDVVVVGGGFSGMYMLHKLRTSGYSVIVFEAGDGIGGTWYWNRYPGARCDIQSMEYSYQFSDELAQDWEWTERYATQPEILRYIEHVAERFDLMKDVQLNTRVGRTEFDEGTNRWQVTTDQGDAVDAKYLVMATGCLSSTNYPQIDGLESFSGACYHTGKWPHEGVDFSGKRVAVVGTGSSGIQSIPIIAAECDELTVFQRTPNFSIPAHNQPLDPGFVAKIKGRYRAFRDENRLTAFHADFDYNEENALDVDPAHRTNEYERRWAKGGISFMAAFADLMFDKNANATAKEFLHDKIDEIVRDPDLAAKLKPDGVVGCKRLCVDTDYFATFNRDNVSLVDINETPIRKITANGVEIDEGVCDVDIIVFATGFDAMTGALTRVDIRGRGGERFSESWAEGPKSFLGLGVQGFPNMFIITGPGSPSVLTNMLPSIEHHVDWIGDCISYLEERGVARIEAKADAQEDWVAHVNEVGDTSVYPQCNSWYLGSNVPGKSRVFLPYLGFPPYAEKCAEVANNDYEGFELSA